MLELVKNFLFEKFWLPIIDESVYYNPYNTIVYAVIFGLAIIYVIRPLIRKLDIKIDRNFIAGFIPFIVFGGAFRVLKDTSQIDSILLETPFIYIILILGGLSNLYLSKLLGQKVEKPYYQILAVIGILQALSILPLLKISELSSIAIFAIITLIWSLPGYLILKYYSTEYMRWEFMMPVTAHYLDATSTFTALQYGGAEKHVLGQFFIDLFGNIGIFILKTSVIIPVVIYIIKNFDGQERAFYIFITTILGLGIATRNLLQTAALN